MQKQQIHEVLGRLADGSPVELVKGVVIGYDTSGTLRMYNADMTQEELIVACELTKARALGLAHTNELPQIIAGQMAAQVQRASEKPQVITGLPMDHVDR